MVVNSMTGKDENRLLSSLSRRLEEEPTKVAKAKKEAPRTKVAVLKEELGTEPRV